MKKLIAISAMLLVVLFASGVAYGLGPESDTIAVMLTVGPIFSIDIGDAVLDWGAVAEGSAGSGGTSIYCRTNQGYPWTILVSATAVLGGSTGAEIPMDPNLKFSTYTADDWGGNPSVGTFTSERPLALTDQLAYTAAASEYSDTDVVIGMYLVLDVPYGTIADTYVSTITATMTE